MARNVENAGLNRNVTIEERRGNMSDKPSELHEIIERRRLSPGQVALLLDNGSLALMNSATGMQIPLDAAASNSLLDLFDAPHDLLPELATPGHQAAPYLAEQT